MNIAESFDLGIDADCTLSQDRSHMLVGVSGFPVQFERATTTRLVYNPSDHLSIYVFF